MVGFAATFAIATPSAKSVVEYGVLVGIGTLYGIVLARRFDAPTIVDGQRVTVQVAILDATVLGIALGPARQSASRWVGLSLTRFQNRSSCSRSTS